MFTKFDGVIRIKSNKLSTLRNQAQLRGHNYTLKGALKTRDCMENAGPKLHGRKTRERLFMESQACLLVWFADA